jgi:hypothetical protein
LGYDTFYYLEWIRQVVATGPFAFASSQHFIDSLYPILASVPVLLGASPELVEVLLPPFLACLTVVAVAVLALMSNDEVTSMVSVLFASGWFALYRMGADFHANLLAFPLLIFASTCLIGARRQYAGKWKLELAFLFLVAVAAAAHVEATVFFLAVWSVAFLVASRRSENDGRHRTIVIIAAGWVIALPLILEYVTNAATSQIGQYCVFPPYWLQVLGPSIVLAILGLVVLSIGAQRGLLSSDYSRLVVSWSFISVLVGVLGYISPFPIGVSDRALLLLPVPLLSAPGLVWLLSKLHLSQRQSTGILVALMILIPLSTVPVVYAYAAPHYQYFANHSTAFVECNSTVANLSGGGQDVWSISISAHPQTFVGVFPRLTRGATPLSTGGGPA